MTVDEATPETPLREQIAREIRTLLAWHNISAAELARRTGMTQPYVSRRMQGGVAFDVDDLEAIAEVLEVDVLDLFPGGPVEPVAVPARAEPRPVARSGRARSRRLTASYRVPAAGTTPDRPTGHVAPARRPRPHSPTRPPNRHDHPDDDRPVRLTRPATPTRTTRTPGDDVP